MNKYLKSASERFDKKFKKEFLINPISNTDSEIIVELGQIIKKLGGSDVLAILDEYKFKKDEEIRDDLIQWNIDHPKTLKKKESTLVEELLEEETPSEPPFLEIGDLILRPYHIFALQMFEDYNEDTDTYTFGIILNPMPEGADLKKVPLFANEHLLFLSEENRNEVLENIKNFLRDTGIDVINITEDE